MVVCNRTHSISKVCLHCFVTGEMFSVNNTDLMTPWALPASQTVDEAMGGPGGSGKWEAPFACHLQRNGDHPQLQRQRRRGRLFAHIQSTSSFLSWAEPREKVKLGYVEEDPATDWRPGLKLPSVAWPQSENWTSWTRVYFQWMGVLVLSLVLPAFPSLVWKLEVGELVSWKGNHRPKVNLKP